MMLTLLVATTALTAPLNIDCGRQLFVDDYLIAETNGVVRYWNRPVKAEDPVIWPGDGAGAAARPKGEKPANLTCSSDGGIWWDPTLGKYRLWYQADWCGDICYAESRDGIRWEYPDLGKVPGTNRVFADDDVDSWCVIPGYDTDKPYANWRLQISAPENGSDDTMWTSTDGRTFVKVWTGGISGDRTTCYYDPFRGNWVFSLREYRPETVGRCRLHFASKRFGGEGCSWHWTGIGKKKERPGREHLPVPTDVVACTNGANRSLYSFNAVAYESVLLGVMEVLYNTPGDNGDCCRRGLPKQTHLHYCFSRDGRTFVPRKEADLSPAGWGTGKWDTGYLSPVGGICVIRDERLWFYYSAMRGDATETTPRQKDPEVGWRRNGMHFNGSVGVASLRRDGFVGLVADGRGELTTNPVRFTGGHLFVNAECRFGSVAAEVLDESGNPIEGFALADCTPVERRDETKAELRFCGDLAKLAGRAVRFRFKLHCGTLYSFWVSPSARGESRGYLAAGGPDYPGLRDL